MSGFFKTGSSSESDRSSGDEDDIPQPVATNKSTTARFIYSDDEEDTKRIVRPAKDKKFEEINDVIRQIKNHKKIKDISKVLGGFEDLLKCFQKNRAVLSGDEKKLPRFYIRSLVELEDFVNECWEDKRKFNKVNGKSLATLRHKLKKHNRDIDDEIKAYRENPDVSDEEKVADDDDDDDSSTYEEDGIEKKVDMKKAQASQDFDSDDFDSDFQDSDTSSSSSDEGEGRTFTAAYFLKTEKTSVDKDKQREKEERRQQRELEKKKQREEEEAEAGEWTKVDKGIPVHSEKPKMFAKDAEITHALVLKKLNEITAARGKKGTDRKDQISMLRELRKIADENKLGVGMDLKILMNIGSSIFDYNPNVASCMKDNMWEQCLEFINEMLDIAANNMDMEFSQGALDQEQVETAPYFVVGCPLTVIERLDKEYVKILQNTDAHSTEYVVRLQDEETLCGIIDRLQKYMEVKGTPAEICRNYLLQIEHMYYKYDYKNMKGSKEDTTKKEEKEQADNGEKKDDEKEDEEKDEKEEEEKNEKVDEEKPETQKESVADFMDRMCKYIYTKDSTNRIRTRAMLCHIYHHAMHDRWYKARDLMLMSHLQDNITHSDIPTQILYNRTLVQLGLCAFRHGNVKDAHNALLDIQSGGRAKELLAQGLLMQKQLERSPEQEKIEKRRQMPFHMHINLELLECTYLVSAMLIEIPYMASHQFDIRRRMISKSFHHQLRLSERQPLVGPPESMREHVMAASRAMRLGDWKACRDFLINKKMMTKVWSLFHNRDGVLELLTRKIQEESLRTYLFTYGSVYDSISMVTLSERFEIDKAVVHSIISKMIIGEELSASWDEPAATIVMHRCEPTRIQTLALQLAEKANNLVDNNERLMEHGGVDGRSRGNDDRDGRQQGRGKQYGNKNYPNRNYQGGNRTYGNRSSNYQGRRRNQRY
ncbi:eukaryotic translation initiation factor 3 subunit C-like [Anneissia japonica]|uniref:eukaryotic translation initiation factor 3 subunit C-like n=1 Tax=Anneissia japonica TaxID=1529436 RepID=UPI00142596A8|nr:eukaryotic translation initiation factor 3 subunit C-like [Anneissia japonica]